jgi:Aerobic-type carbon monoxide dehydrogenase, small subunit CoxS/CutS homologs
MVIHLKINGQSKDIPVQPNETLLVALRREGYFSVKHGCETGECGACGVIMRMREGETPAIVNTCVMLAAQAHDAEIITVESLGDRRGLSVLQQCFTENGAIQCGYCTPAQILAAKALLDRKPNPTEAEVRDAIGGVLCRCTGYIKPVQAVLNAAALLRGEQPDDLPPAFRRVIAPEGTGAGSPAPSGRILGVPSSNS